MGSGMGLDGCHACIKYLMFAFNLIFWLIGCGLVGFGIFVLVDEQFQDLAENSNFELVRYAGVALTVIGAVVMVIGFFGCCGAIRESQCLLVSFFICLFVLFVALVGAGAYWLIDGEKIINDVQKSFDDEVKKYGENKEESPYLSLVQGSFKCCGYNGREDYTNQGILPDDFPTSCPEAVDEKVLTDGCKDEVKNTLTKYGMVVAGVAIGAGIVMLLGMIFSMLLCCAIRDLAD